MALGDLSAVSMIMRRDLIRFSRDRAAWAGSLARPFLWLLVLGLGMGSAFSGFKGASYVEYLFPGIVGLNLLFASFLSAISIIWDREFGFLKEMLVAPISRHAIALGKAASGATVSTLQGCLVLCFLPLVGVRIPWTRFIEAFPAMFLIAFAMTSLGLVVASRMTSFEGFGTVANFVIMPMFFLSGALFPLDKVPRWILVFSHLNPMVYAVDALRAILLGVHTFSLPLDLLVLTAFSVLSLSLAVWAFCYRI
ncbi:MAG: ABC transporter permease [Candidatus Omnitrophica bacterium]|nr:ABC transporter permease [Candidatus Omnitrophota bacterium]